MPGIVVKVFNNLGYIVYQANIENTEKNVIQVSCATWQKGIYQIVTMDENNILSRRKIVIH
jgi:hypothetical protein